jgi:general secretion pathway protein I
MNHHPTHIFKPKKLRAVFQLFKKSLCLSSGFTLIETLVAMMLLSISLVVILQLFSGGLKSGKIADDYTRAIFHARAKMEEILLMTDLDESFLEGAFDDGYKWRVNITRVETEENETEEEMVTSPPLNFVNVEVIVSWSSGDKNRDFTLTTLQVAETSEPDMLEPPK